MTADMTPEVLIHLYREELQALFAEHELPTMGLTAAAEALDAALKLPTRVSVGFVGESQVGKSSLINALLGRRALPAGGVGPLTMRATEVEHSDEPRFHVGYHGREALNRLRFSIETYLKRRGELRGNVELEAPSEDAAAEVEASFEQEMPRVREATITDAGEPDKSATTHRTSELGEQLVTQARILLSSGRADEEVAPLSRLECVDGLRLVLGQRPRGDTSGLQLLAVRIEEIRLRLGTSEVVERASFDHPREFTKELRKRATGWLSQLVEELRVYLDQPLLKHVSLVDLPGVGVLGDSAGKEAEKFVKARGDALVLVVRNTGATHELASLLERTGVITRLLFGDRADVPPIHIKIAVTHLDNVAYEKYAQLAQIAADEEAPPPSRDAVFAQLSQEMAGLIRSQIRNHLLGSEAFSDLEGDARAARESVVERLVDRLEVICVAAPDYLDILAGQPSRFIQTKEGTGVPAMEASIARLGTEVVARREERTMKAFAELRDGLVAHLAAVVTMYEEGGGKATAEWERFRKDLEAARAHLASEMTAYHARTLTILQEKLPERLELVSVRAQQVAQKRLDRIRKRAEELYFPSLNAALLRNGRWENKNLDYPGDLTRAFVDSIASEWETSIVEEIRKTIRDAADQDVRLVEKLCQVAATHDVRIVADAHIEAQKKVLQQQSRSSVRWTQERLDGLRSDVEAHLFDVVLDPIAQACRKAVAQNRNHGEGAKRRILEVFHEGASGALEKARERAVKLLRGHYDALLNDLTAGYLAQHHDPVSAAYSAMTNEELARARRSDAGRRRHVLERVESARLLLGAS
jgi:hypothetical protein